MVPHGEIGFCYSGFLRDCIRISRALEKEGPVENNVTERWDMDTSQIISVAIFVVAMIAIMTEKVHRALVAITGAMLLLILHIMPFETAIGHIDFNTLGVLFGMMLFVAVVKQSGVFEFLAIKCARVAKGNPWTIMVLFVLLTAVLSAFLDNVTTVLLIGPMTITVCRLLDIDRCRSS